MFALLAPCTHRFAAMQSAILLAVPGIIVSTCNIEYKCANVQAVQRIIIIIASHTQQRMLYSRREHYRSSSLVRFCTAADRMSSAAEGGSVWDFRVACRVVAAAPRSQLARAFQIAAVRTWHMSKLLGTRAYVSSSI